MFGRLRIWTLWDQAFEGYGSSIALPKDVTVSATNPQVFTYWLSYIRELRVHHHTEQYTSSDLAFESSLCFFKSVFA